MTRGYTLYRQKRFDAASPREQEIVAFGLANRQLAAAATPVERIGALHRNQLLWSTLMRDLSSDGNGLPDKLRRTLADLASWSMAYSIRAMARDLPLQPLIVVNENMIDGLRAQASPAAMAPAAPPGMASGMASGAIAV